MCSCRKGVVGFFFIRRRKKATTKTHVGTPLVEVVILFGNAEWNEGSKEKASNECNLKFRVFVKIYKIFTKWAVVGFFFGRYIAAFNHFFIFIRRVAPSAS